MEQKPVEPLAPITPVQMLALRIFAYSADVKYDRAMKGFTPRGYNVQLRIALRHVLRECAPHVTNAMSISKGMRQGYASDYLEKMTAKDMSDPLF